MGDYAPPYPNAATDPFNQVPGMNQSSREAAPMGDIEQLQAENERLRAEVEQWRSLHATAYDAFRTGVAIERRLEARAERLAEALRWYVDNDDTNDGQEGNEFWLAGRDRARAALAQEDRNG